MLRKRVLIVELTPVKLYGRAQDCRKSDISPFRTTNDIIVAMAKIIVLANQKGGVAKTTSTINLAQSLVRLSKRVLIIDADPQANATLYLGHNPYELQDRHKTLHFCLVANECDLASIAIPGDPALIPSSIILAKADRELMQGMRYSDELLKQLLQPIQDQFDFILIDSQPHLGILTSNALAAAHMVLIPVRTERFAIWGVPLLLEETDATRQRVNPDLEIFGILPTMYNKSFTQDQEALSALQDVAAKHGIKVFEPIPRSTEYDKAPWYGKSTVELAPETAGVSVYKEVAKKLLAYD